MHKLKKALYGLKPTLRTWYSRMDSFLMSQVFTKHKENSNLYLKVEGGILVMIFLCVDDMFLIGEDELIKYARRRLAIEFEMKELGIMHYFLGMEVWQNADGIFLGQGKYAEEILNKFGMLDCKAIATPMESNLKLLCEDSSYSFDSMAYH